MVPTYLIIKLMSKIISFASDFGLEDGSVGIVKGVINRIDPDLRINDISHGIPAQNIKQGSLLLMRAIQYIPQGVLLAVVDPGVGTERKPIALDTEWGVMIGPDNGLLNLACATVGGAQRGYLLENARDLFSPFAAGYASGQLSIEDFGSELDLSNLNQYLIPLTEATDSEIKGEILWVDHYGNCQTNVSPEELRELKKSIGDVINIKIGNAEIKTTWVDSYQGEYLGEVGLITDSWGMVSLFATNKNASSILNIKDGAKINFSI